MELNNYKVLRVSLPLHSSPLETNILVPMDIILHLTKFTRFEDYRNFVRCFWPADYEPDVIRSKLWKLSTHTIKTRFLNGQPLNVEYNFDASRTPDRRTLLNVRTLLPVFGGVLPPGKELFISPTKLQNFIRMHVHLNMCSERKLAACLCHQLKMCGHTGVRIVKPPEIACKYGHFHHYCSQHVRNWLDFYLAPAVLLREMPSLFNQDMADSFLLFLSNTVHVDQR